MAFSKERASGALSTDWLLATAVLTEANEAVSETAFGSVFEDHFHPGALVGSSRRESMRSAEKVLSPWAFGRSRRVMEKPGMLRLVYADVSGLFVWKGQTHHERSGQDTYRFDTLLV